MKRSDAIKKLMTKVVSPFEVIRKENYDSGEYERRAERLLEFIEKELGMKPPGYMKPIPADERPLVPGDIKNDAGVWCTPGIQQWEPE